MAITITPLGLAGDLRVFTDSDVDNTAENNVNDGAATIYSIVIDNTANAATSYIKFYNAAAPTVGTTAPDMILMMPASVEREFTFPDGVVFSSALSWAGVTTAGTAGTTGPTSNVVMRVVVG